MKGLDFSRIASGSASDSATEPRRIFSALPAKDAKYGYPRDVQSEVWEGWHDRRDERDLVIKLNTGSGKTVVGLIALKSCLNESVGPAAYITPDIPLTEQVTKEAEQLGLEVTGDFHSPRFQQGHAILVANIYKLFNGRSVFGVKGGSRQPIKMGAVLIDDAHACLATVDEQYTLKVPSDHDAYEELFHLFTADLSLQSHSGVLNIEGGDPGVVLPIPFWAWVDQQERVMKILHPHRDSEDFRFSWPLLVDSLPLCRAAISAEAIEIAPPCPPIETIPSFDRAKRRLYLTATLSDDSVLVTHFGADPTSIRTPITPRAANDLGDRMILTPLQTFPECDEDVIREFAADQAKTRNVVVIVPSWSRSETWELYAEATYGASDLQEGLDDLRAGHVGLVVLVNKYDGIDLPGDACHLLILDGLPEALGTLDRLEMAALEDSDALLNRQVQRIEQGMGRGVRSNDDYCVVLLLGRNMTARLHPPAARQMFSPATRAQLGLSDQVAQLLNGHHFDEFEAVVDQCLDRDPDWIAASRDALDEVTYSQSSVISPFALAQRTAFDLASAERFQDATESLQSAIDEVGDQRLRGILKQEAATYIHRYDPVKAQKLQASAFNDNRGLTRPHQAMKYARLRGDMSSQPQAAATYLKKTYKDGSGLLVGTEALLEKLTPSSDPASVPSFEQGMLDLASHLGLAGQRPEQEIGRGPDVLWQLDDRTYLVIECKSGSAQEEIAKNEMAQLSQSIDWFEEAYGQGIDAVPVLIHPSRDLEKRASARSGARVLTFEKLHGLLGSLRTLATALASCDPFLDVGDVQERLAALQLNAAAIADHWTVKPRRPR